METLKNEKKGLKNQLSIFLFIINGNKKNI